jgi:hypothetical protein
MPRSLRTFLEFLAAFIGLVVLVMALVAWRLSASPINSTFLTPYIEAGIERYVPDAHAQIAHTLLTWDNADRSVTLHADGFVIKNGKDSAIAEVPSLDIRLSLFGLVVGQFWPVELTVNHPQLKLVRHADGKLYFADLETGSDTSDDQNNSREVLQKTMLNLTHAYAMRHMTVYHAVLDIHDDVTNRNWSVSVPEVSLVRTFTQLVGDAKIDLTQKEGPASLELHYAYDHIKSLHRVSTRFKDITPAQLAGGHPETLGLAAASIFDLPLSGEMEVAFDPDLDVAAAAATLHGGKGALHAPVLWDKPRTLNSFDLEGDFDRKAHQLNIVTAAADFDGAKLNITATGHKPADSKKYDLDFTMKAALENWPMDKFEDLWPKPIITNARDWMAQNLSKGIYEKGEGVFNGSLAWNDLANLDMTSGQGKVTASRGTVTYIDGMPPVVGVRTEADFDLTRMTLAISDGGIGNLKIQPFSITITGLDKDDQYIDIPLKLTGPIIEIVKLIDHKPLSYATAVGLPTDALSGAAEGQVNMHFPLYKTLSTKDIDVTATAHLSNVASSKLVKGVDVTEGDLALDLDKDGFAAKGPLRISKMPFLLDFHQYFHAMTDKPLRQVNLSGELKDEDWKVLGEDFAGTHGRAVVTFQMTQPSKAKTLVSGTMDFTGTELYLHPLNWRKPQNMSATLQWSGEMVTGKDMVIKSIALRSSLAHANGKAVISPEGILKSVSFEPFVMGRTSANLSFSQSDEEDGALVFEARGKSLDVSGIKGGKDPARADPRPKEYHLKIGKLYTGENGIIANAEGFAIRDAEGWKAISLHGLADGEHKLAIDLTPEADGKSTFKVTCDDFGKMMKGLGLTDTVREGEVDIEGVSAADNPRVIEGTAKIGSFSVGQLPVLMQLLNATSPFGFVGLVTDRADFEHLKGDFRWAGDEVTLIHVNAAGSSVGMNIDGKVDMNSGRANLHGTMVPFSMVNRILGSIPLLGDILTGGNGGGVLAVSYGIKGSLSDPKISVNPVSLLTPGFLRNLFFGDNGDDAIPPEDAAPPSKDAVTP